MLKKQYLILLLALFVAVGVTASFAITSSTNGATAHPAIVQNAIYLPFSHTTNILPATHPPVTILNLPKDHQAVPIKLPPGHQTITLPAGHEGVQVIYHPAIDPKAIYLPYKHPTITLPATHPPVTIINLPQGHPAVPIKLPANHPPLNLPPCHPAIPTSCEPAAPAAPACEPAAPAAPACEPAAPAAPACEPACACE